LWRGKYADEKNTNNFGGFKNAEVDALIDQYLLEFNEKKRLVIMQKIDRILVREMPTILLWAPAYSRVLYWNKFETSDKIFSKYGDEDTVYEDWSVSPEKTDLLLDAIRNNVALPEEPIEVYYDASLRL
jgi:ABC-type oligopeptide transport system substrate-binding subunit